jgi:hypothetical protein
MTNNTYPACPYWGADWGYECPFGGHGVCFDSSPCDGPIEEEKEND